jgi:hypothetical protein
MNPEFNYTLINLISLGVRQPACYPPSDDVARDRMVSTFSAIRSGATPMVAGNSSGSGVIFDHSCSLSRGTDHPAIDRGQPQRDIGSRTSGPEVGGHIQFPALALPAEPRAGGGEQLPQQRKQLPDPGHRLPIAYAIPLDIHLLKAGAQAQNKPAVRDIVDVQLPEARGLALDSDSNLMNDIAFLLFVIGIGIVIAIMTKIAWHCLFSAR